MTFSAAALVTEKEYRSRTRRSRAFGGAFTPKDYPVFVEMCSEDTIIEHKKLSRDDF